MDDRITCGLTDEPCMTDFTTSANHGVACGGSTTSFTKTSRFTGTYRPSLFGYIRIEGNTDFWHTPMVKYVPV